LCKFFPTPFSYVYDPNIIDLALCEHPKNSGGIGMGVSFEAENLNISDTGQITHTQFD